MWILLPLLSKRQYIFMERRLKKPKQKLLNAENKTKEVKKHENI